MTSSKSGKTGGQIKNVGKQKISFICVIHKNLYSITSGISINFNFLCVLNLFSWVYFIFITYLFYVLKDYIL